MKFGFLMVSMELLKGVGIRPGRWSHWEGVTDKSVRSGVHFQEPKQIRAGVELHS